MAINTAGNVIAWSQQSNGVYGSFLWDGSTTTSIGTFGGATYAYDINDSNVVVGFSQGPGFTHAFSWQNGTMTDLGTLDGNSYAYGINNNGTIVGDFEHGGHTAFRYQNGQMTAMELYPEMNLNRALAVNDADVVVGFGRLNAGGFRALLWNDDKVFGLNDMVVNGAGWTLALATDINNSGQIVGLGSFGGQEHVFLLNPIPGPSALAPILMSLIVATRRRRY